MFRRRAPRSLGERPPFPDRFAAGEALVSRLQALHLADSEPRPLVLALPRGGVPVAAVVARSLRAPLDLLLVRKIGAPGQPELAVAALVDGTPPRVVANGSLCEALGVDTAYLTRASHAAIAENARRRRLYLGGRPTPGIGFGLGLDRVVIALGEQGAEAPHPAHAAIVVVGADPADTVPRLWIATLLRAGGLSARADLAPRKLGKQLEGAAKEGAHFAVICGDELEAGQVQVKDLQAGTQRKVDIVDLVRELQRGEAQHKHGTGEA